MLLIAKELLKLFSLLDQNIGQICFTSHWPHSISWFLYFVFDNIFCKSKKYKKRRIKPVKFPTTIGNI